MILSKLHFFENKGENNFWEIKNLQFNMINLIVGLNATGKTRLVNVISNTAKIISKKKTKLLNGNWDIEFKHKNGTFKYILEIYKKKVKFEKIIIGNKIVLNRKNDSGKIFSYTLNKKIDINPPLEELTLHVRRDTKEFPFFEELLKWADNLLGYRFTAARPDHIVMPINPENDDYLEDLAATPYLLQKSLDDNNFIKNIIKDFSEIGYPIEKVYVNSKMITGLPNEIITSVVKEKDLSCQTEQTKMSQGMFRAFSLIVIIEYLLKHQKECTVIIDDLGEGLDFERSSKLTKLLINKIKNSKIQLIITSNDRFLINSIDLKYLTLLERNAHIIESYNYFNNKKLFDEFKYTGLNNFDLFSGKLYKQND